MADWPWWSKPPRSTNSDELDRAVDFYSFYRRGLPRRPRSPRAFINEEYNKSTTTTHALGAVAETYHGQSQSSYHIPFVSESNKISLYYSVEG